MQRLTRNILLSCLGTFVLLLASCGESGNRFKIEGRLLQMNQGEFYIYSDDESINGIDTIKVQGGRFEYDMPCEHPITLTIVFPNFSEQPIFAEPGKTVKIDGDASHLKELKVKGTKDNELMTSFRQQIDNASPPEIARYAKQFVKDNPQSPVGVWLVRKYFIATATPDYKAASELIKTMQARQKDNGLLNRMSQGLANIQKSTVGNSLPSFSVKDINGKTFTSADLSSGTAVICTWASWSYNSTNMLRQLKDALKDKGGVKVLTFSLDADAKDSKNFMEMNQVDFPIVCTGELFDTKPLQQLGMLTVPDNIIVVGGKIVAHGLATNDLVNKLK